ncbi:MAG TPA: hypothetical protein VIW03_17215, partial [Anaeromyxobacter sp.]
GPPPGEPVRTSSILASALLSLAPLASSAADLFEIQVYDGSIDAPGHAGLEVHANYTARGTRVPEYPGQIAPDRVARVTLEPSYGVAEWLELGLYLQGFYSPDGNVRYGGWKARAKLVVPERLGLPVRLGMNLEVGRVPVSVEKDGWANEFRPFVGWTAGRLSLAVNPIFGYALTGPDRFRVDLEPAVKVSWKTDAGFAVGAEYYASLGFANAVLPLREGEHLAFITLGLAERPGAAASPWELEVGFGAGLTEATPQRAVVKLILGRAF